MKFVITIPQWHPVTINKLLASHFGKRIKLKKLDVQMIGAYSRHIPKAHKLRRVEIMVYAEGSGRRPDGDAHTKSVLDALVQNKLLTDDNREGCELMPTQILDGPMKTVINLYEAD